ncbi:NAD(P)-dependent oxidoreductase [Saccharopolyspora taberi]|uniref:NAD(P)-dependent oxidoreductase n=1 Tax=Saccharopolyspora taberi TaxID=60895 RepID=A0ABN3VDR0_9PSEU
MKVAVTGARGTIGRALTRALADAGHQVRAIDRTGPDPVDTGDYPRLRDAVHGNDALIHLAGIPTPWHDPGHLVHNTNVTGSYNALSAATECGIDRIVLASSINAVGGAFSRRAHYDYFPVDETHPTYNEDPYSLSKWIAETQADSFARRHPDLTITSLRLHGATPDRATAAAHGTDPTMTVNHLWGYVRLDAVTQACLLALHAPWTGHQVCNIVAPDTITDTDSRTLAARHYPDVPIRGDLDGRAGFYDCTKAKQLLGWTHPPATT